MTSINVGWHPVALGVAAAAATAVTVTVASVALGTAYHMPAQTTAVAEKASFGLRVQIALLRFLSAVVIRNTLVPSLPKDIRLLTWEIPQPQGHRTRVLVLVPEGVEAAGDGPIVVDIHGGGFCGGAPEDEVEFGCRVAKELKCTVVLASYGLAPEHPHPAGVEDCEGVVQWLRETYPDSNIAVGGFSAGGTLAYNTVLKFKGDPKVKLVYAWYAPADFSKASDNDFEEKDNPYKRNMFHEAYLLGHPQDLAHPRLSPAYAPSADLPPTAVFIAASIDPNIRDIVKLQDRLAAEHPHFIGRNYPDVPHGWNFLPKFALGEDGLRKKEDGFVVTIDALRSALFC